PPQRQPAPPPVPTRRSSDLPGYVQRMKQNPDKTDCQDAQLLADLERVGYLPRVWLAPRYIRELRHVVRYRLQLTEQRRATKLRLDRKSIRLNSSHQITSYAV